jgi:ABC-type branched-subunit amino acid transport system substrate-binding protein
LKTGYKLAVLIAIFFFCACARIPETPHIPPVQVDSESEMFSRAERVFRLKSYNEALKLYDDYLLRYSSGASVPAALMRKAEIHAEMGNYARARGIYNDLIARYPNSSIVTDARVEILATFYNEGQYREVIRHADETLKRIASIPHILKIYVLLGDSYMATGDPINAVNLYTSAQKNAAYPEKENIIARLKQAVKQLSASDILFLMERVEDPLTKGYLMYQLGVKYREENRLADAERVFSELAQMFPNHEAVQDAKRFLPERGTSPAYTARRAVGCLLPLSGSYQIYGNRALKGIELARDQYGSAAEFIVKDTASDPRQAVQGVQELAQAGVAAIIGPIITAEAAAAEAQDKGIPIVTFTQKEGITDIGDCVFRNFLTPKMQVEAIVSYATRYLGLYNFAVLYPEEKYGDTFMHLFWDELVSQGGKVVSVESYDPNQTDFSGPIRKLAGRYYRKRSDADFDAIFIPDAPAKAGLIIPQLAFYDIYNVKLFGTNLWHSDRLIKMAKKFVQGAVLPDVFFAESYSENVRNFVGDFRAKFGESPGFIEAIAYDTAIMLFRIIERADMQYGDTVKKELMQLRDFRGVAGLTSFDDKGEAHKKIYLLRIEGDGFTEVETY